jgi:hypothetical protein
LIGANLVVNGKGKPPRPAGTPPKEGNRYEYKSNESFEVNFMDFDDGKEKAADFKLLFCHQFHEFEYRLKFVKLVALFL